MKENYSESKEHCKHSACIQTVCEQRVSKTCINTIIDDIKNQRNVLKKGVIRKISIATTASAVIITFIILFDIIFRQALNKSIFEYIPLVALLFSTIFYFGSVLMKDLRKTPEFVYVHAIKATEELKAEHIENFSNYIVKQCNEKYKIKIYDIKLSEINGESILFISCK